MRVKSRVFSVTGNEVKENKGSFMKMQHCNLVAVSSSYNYEIFSKIILVISLASRNS